MTSARRPGGRRATARPGAGPAPRRTIRPAAPRAAVRPEAPIRSVRATEHRELPEPPPKVSLTGRAAILALVLVVLVLSFALPLRGWFDQRGELGAVREDIAADQQAITDLERQLERWEDPRYVETQARERLRWVRPGDVGYIVLDDDPPDEPTVAEAAAAGELWWQRLWTGVATVDQGDLDE